ncbi:MAG: hypothetical protein JWR61_5340 [Ferruginibacter sp.]|nr:hypothetical protein [Ferruginibacter sp.]
MHLVKEKNKYHIKSHLFQFLYLVDFKILAIEVKK